MIREYTAGHSIRNEKGIALVAALLFLMVLTLVGTTAIMISSTDIKIGGNYKTGKQAFYTAEAGINRIIAYYKANPAEFTAKNTAGTMGFSATKPTTANFGSDLAYWFPSITYDAAASPTWVEIEGHGTVIGTNVDHKIVLRLAALPSSVFSHGVFGDEGVTLSGQGDIDSYNSSVGIYSVSHGSNGDTGTNATGSGAITMSGQAEIYGDAFVGPGGSPSDITTSGLAQVVPPGTKNVAGQTKDTTPESAPGGCTPITIPGSGVGTTTVTGGTYSTSGLSLSGQRIVEISGDVTLVINGDFSTSGQSQIRVPPGSSLTIYVTGSINMSGQGILNQNNTPEDCLIYGTSTCSSVSLSGQADLCAAVYAPNANATFSGQADIYGAIIANRVTISGQGDVHYDEALGNLGGGGGVSGFQIVSWKDGSM